MIDTALAHTTTVVALPGILDPINVLSWFGAWAFWGLLLVVFIESGVLFPVLPGDSLLFVAGMVVAAGGSISAEHGIGALKRHELAERKPAVALKLMRAVKQALDTDDFGIGILLLVMGAAFGVGAAISRTPPPTTRACRSRASACWSKWPVATKSWPVAWRCTSPRPSRWPCRSTISTRKSSSAKR